MRIRTLFFATYRELAGTAALDVDLPPGATAADLVSRLRGHGNLGRLPTSPAIAINEEYAPLATALADGDEVAFLPPVAGG